MLRARFLAFAILAAGSRPAFATAPSDLVPARWNSTNPKSLTLLAGTPINCILLSWSDKEAPALAAFATAAGAKGISPFAILTPGTDPVTPARAAVRAHFAGIVLEGDFPLDVAARLRDALTDTRTPVVEISARNHMRLGGAAPILGTYQGVWPGIQVEADGAAKAGPSGSAWIDTNSGFLRAARAWGNATIWLANLPPAKSVITPERYLQVIGDAAMTGSRWVIALDDDFWQRLLRSDPASLKSWGRIGQLLQFNESHPEWRAFTPFGKLAIVQGSDDGALLSGGILDMIAVRHTPVRAIPPQKLTRESLAGASMTVNVDTDALSPEQREILQAYTRAGGTVFTGPPGWKEAAPRDTGRITLNDKELKHIDEIWHDMQALIGRKNLGARLFNVSSMLSNLMSSPDNKQVIVNLVNYSEYPAEDVTVMLLGKYHHATLFMPDAKTRDLEVYDNEEGSGVDISKVPSYATLRLD